GVLAVAGLAAFWLRAPLPLPRVTGYTSITNDGHEKRGPAVTDGVRIYFIELIGGRLALTHVSASGGEAAQIPTLFSNSNLSIHGISPNRSELLIGSGIGNQPGVLWVLPMPAGTPRRLSDPMAGDAAWSPDGGQMIFVK